MEKAPVSVRFRCRRSLSDFPKSRVMSNLSDTKQVVADAPEVRSRFGRERIVSLLRSRGVSPTSQRVSIAMELLPEPTHLCAEEVARRVALRDDNVSRATVYNTLRCFVEHGLIRQVNVGADRVIYDSNIAPHHHFYDPENEELIDIDTSEIRILGVPKLPEGRELDTLELVIRLKPSRPPD